MHSVHPDQTRKTFFKQFHDGCTCDRNQCAQNSAQIANFAALAAQSAFHVDKEWHAAEFKPAARVRKLQICPDIALYRKAQELANSKLLERYAPIASLGPLQTAVLEPLPISFFVASPCAEAHQAALKNLKFSVSALPGIKGAYRLAHNPVSTVQRKRWMALLIKRVRKLSLPVCLREFGSILACELFCAATKQARLILDMCSAPGGKAVQMAIRRNSEGGLILNDISAARLQTISQAFTYAVLPCPPILCGDGRRFGADAPQAYDAVFCDAPCSGTGRIRQDVFALQRYPHPQKFAALQRELLLSAAAACKPGGLIAYSTCSLEPAENEEVVAAVLKETGGALKPEDPRNFGLNLDLNEALENSAQVQAHLQLKPLLPCVRLWPYSYNCLGGGFFAAFLRKAA